MSNEVETLLRDKGVYFTVSGNDFLTKCLNPDHEDTHPSFRVDKVRGIGHCFSCNFKINIFKYYGIITNQVNIRVAGLKEKLNVLKQSTAGLDMLDGYTPLSDQYRGISRKTLEKFGAFSTDKVTGMEDRVIFPLLDITGKIKVFIGRHTMSNVQPRYMIYPKNVSMPLVPPALEVKSTSLVLVEGMFDLLNLYDKGLHNVVATMGTNSLNNDSARYKLLPFKALGVTHVYIAFDGDTAGVEAAPKVKERLESYGFIVEIVPLEEGRDPGDMSQDEVDSLKEHIK